MRWRAVMCVSVLLACEGAPRAAAADGAGRQEASPPTECEQAWAQVRISQEIDESTTPNEGSIEAVFGRALGSYCGG